MLEAGELGALKGFSSIASVSGLSILKEWPAYDFPLLKMAVTDQWKPLRESIGSTLNCHVSQEVQTLDRLSHTVLT